MPRFITLNIKEGKAIYMQFELSVQTSKIEYTVTHKPQHFALNCNWDMYVKRKKKKNLKNVDYRIQDPEMTILFLCSSNVLSPFNLHTFQVKWFIYYKTTYIADTKVPRRKQVQRKSHGKCSYISIQ